MKQLILSALTVALFTFASCTDMEYEIKKQVTEEKVYSGRYDFAKATTGFERVEIDLLQAGRIPASEVKLGKAVKTVVQYSDREIIIDSVCSWVNITGLGAQMYRFKISTMDRYGNRSIPVETTATPYTSEDVKSLSIVPPTMKMSPWMAEVEWSSLSNIQFDYYGGTYSYTDRNNVVHEGELALLNPKVTMENLAEAQPVTLNITLKVLPKVDNIHILDTIPISVPVGLALPSVYTYREGLINRVIQSFSRHNDESELILNWNNVGGNPPEYSEVKYTDYTGVEKTVRAENADNQTVVTGLKTGGSVSVTSYYHPLGTEDNFVVSALTPKSYPVINELRLARQGWTCLSVSDAESGLSGQNVLDNNLSTYWNSQWTGGSPPFPHWLVFDMGSPIGNITRIETYRFQNTNYPDTKTVQYFVGNDSNPDAANWIKIGECEFTNTPSLAPVNITTFLANPNQGRYLKVVLPDNTGNPGRATYTGLAEIYFYGNLTD